MINPHPPFTIAPASAADIGEMNRIEQEAFSTPWSRELLRGAIINPQYQVQALHRQDAGLLGFLIAHGVNHRSNLDNLAVDAWARGQGYGSELISDWIAGAVRAGMDLLTLQVNTDNKRAQKLYQRFDFQTTRLLLSYYPNGDDALQMVRRISPDTTENPEERKKRGDRGGPSPAGRRRIPSGNGRGRNFLKGL